jgi:hypothetical protein
VLLLDVLPELPVDYLWILQASFPRVRIGLRKIGSLKKIALAIAILQAQFCKCNFASAILQVQFCKCNFASAILQMQF